MALVISAVQVTGTATAYTVPTGKIAKVRVVNIYNFSTDKIITVGNFVSRNGTGQTVRSEYQSNGGGGSSTMTGPQVSFLFCMAYNGSMIQRFMYVKEDHVLVAGETVSCDDTGCTMSYTIFEEDA